MLSYVDIASGIITCLKAPIFAHVNVLSWFLHTGGPIIFLLTNPNITNTCCWNVPLIEALDLEKEAMTRSGTHLTVHSL